MHPPGPEGRILAEGLEALLQAIHPQQVVGGGRSDDALDDGGSGQGIAPVTLPQFEDGVGRRIVFGPRLLRQLATGAGRRQGLQRAVEQPLSQGQWPRAAA